MRRGRRRAVRRLAYGLREGVQRTSYSWMETSLPAVTAVGMTAVGMTAVWMTAVRMTAVGMTAVGSIVFTSSQCSWACGLPLYPRSPGLRFAAR